MSRIEVQGLWKSYGDRVVLERVSLVIEPASLVAIVGSSGCGKSTFLRIILGVEQPSRGRILLDGAPLPAEPGPDRGIVFQRYTVFPHLSVLENAALGLELRASRLLGRSFGARRREAHEQAAAMLERVGLGHVLEAFPHELSGGMQQRLALAQALVVEPRVLLLDEPFGALDPGIRADARALLLELWEERGTTVVMVTHDLPEAFQLGTRVLVFDKVRRDPQAPERYGATVTYDLPGYNRRRPRPPAPAASAAAPATGGS
ncbi:MAG: ABC transporter ATP-binding protein [Geminicoccaceae bacterium]|nr:ABC transporter ATP-binding protein [Geminicoccaceae bacterium]MDW8369504.1 ABC transporter ATP-binding protein [Geminicoccaceae bacterium]